MVADCAQFAAFFLLFCALAIVRENAENFFDFLFRRFLYFSYYSVVFCLASRGFLKLNLISKFTQKQTIIKLFLHRYHQLF